MASYHRPHELGEALAVLRDGAVMVIAGGTDYYPARVERPANEDLLDITAISALRRIETTPSHFRIGAGVTWTDLIRAELPPCFDGLKLAARRGRRGADPERRHDRRQCLQCLARRRQHAQSPRPRYRGRAGLGRRRSAGCRSREFVTGNRNTPRRPDEMVTALLIPRSLDGLAQQLPQARRPALSCHLHRDAGGGDRGPAGQAVAAARIAVGACSEVARRPPVLEQALVGRRRARTRASVEAAHVAELSPIDDVRAGAAYRRDAALALLRRALEPMAGGGMIRLPCPQRRPRRREGRAGPAPRRDAARRARPDRHQDRLRGGRLRRLHGAARWRAGLRLPGCRRRRPRARRRDGRGLGGRWR